MSAKAVATMQRLPVADNRADSKRIRRRIRAAFLLAALIPALYCGLVVTHYSLKSGKIPGGGAVRIVLIADLHSTIYGKKQRPLIDRIKAQNPDLIFLIGDIADDETPIRGMSLLLAGIKGLCPIYYTTGNHEYWSRNITPILAEIESHGVRILSDEYVELELYGVPLLIAGVEDPARRGYLEPDYDQPESMEKAFGGLERTGAYKILLAHRPERIGQYLRYPFDLVVSGHAHGGQARIPFLPVGLYSPNQGFFPRLAKGVYDYGETTLVVSRGLSFNPRLPRIFNPPEIVIITLEAE